MKKLQKIFSWVSILSLILQIGSGVILARPAFAEEEVPPETTAGEAQPEPVYSEPVESVGDPAPEAPVEEVVEEEPVLTVEQGDESPPAGGEEGAVEEEIPEGPTGELGLDLEAPEVAEESAELNPSISTDKEDYAPGETVKISGENFPPNSTLLVKVTRPDGSVVKGDGSFEEGSDGVITDEEGRLEYLYQLNGIEGEYVIEIFQGETVLATKIFTDSTIDKITICHATSSETNPFNTLEISYNAVYGPGGHFNENGTTQAGHEQDYFSACSCEDEPDNPDCVPSEVCDDGGCCDWCGWCDVCDWCPCPPEPYCGDGDLDPGEECDDGNNEDGDGCSANCTIEKLCEEGPTWAYAAEDFNQGLRKNSTPVLPARSDPNNALGVPDSPPSVVNFVSLGVGGSIVLSFQGWIRDVEGDDLSFHETTWGRPGYPEEKAQVEVSQNGSSWYGIWEVTNHDGGDGIGYVDFSSTGLTWIRYVRITDTTNYGPLPADADGYDLDAVDALAQVCEEPQLECEEGTVWMIGDEEVAPADNPVDELNWPGVFGVFPAFPNPFVVGTNNDNEFPWNSNYNQSYATDFDVNFNYAGADAAVAQLTVGWSPGKSANEQKEVLLDSVSLGTTPVRLGVPVAGWWNQMARFGDTFTFPLTHGSHVFTFKHLFGDGTLWDFVKLEIISCEEDHGTCGNAVIEHEEECDDGNTQDGDGCSANCTIEEYQEEPILVSIAKTNDKSSGASAGDSVNYILTLTNGPIPLATVTVTDVMPLGFSYVAGSGQVDGVPSEPTVSGSVLTWTLSLAADQVVVITYQTVIDGSQPAGTYYNLATCRGSTPGDGLDLVDGFAVAQVIRRELTAECDVVESSVPIGRGVSTTTEIGGTVLGVTTEVPLILGAATGSETYWLVLAFILIVAGVLIRVSADEKKKALLLKGMTKIGKKLLPHAATILAFFVFAGGVWAIDSLFIKVADFPEYVRGDNLKLYYTALEKAGKSISVVCYVEKDGGFGWKTFGGTQTELSGFCEVFGHEMDGDGTYRFKAVAASVDGSTESNITQTIIDRSGPEAPRDYRKSRESSTAYRIRWRNPGNDDYAWTRIFASTEQNFIADDATKKADVGGGKDVEFDYLVTGLEPNQEYYFALQGFDKAGNQSGLAGDGGSVTYEEIPGEGVAGEGAGGEEVIVLPMEEAEEGEILGEEVPEEEAPAEEEITGLIGGAATQIAGTNRGLLAAGAGALLALAGLGYYLYRRQTS